MTPTPDEKPAAVFEMKSVMGDYKIHGLLRREAYFDTIAAELNGDPVELHVPRLPRSECMIPNAVRAFEQVASSSVPTYIETVYLKDRPAYVTTKTPDDVASLASIMFQYPDNDMPLRQALRHTDLLLRRIYDMERAGIVHGAINPESVLVSKVCSACFVRDWHYSVPVGGRVMFTNNTYEHLCPWDVREKEPVDAGTDMAAAMLMLQEMTANVEVPDELTALISEHLREGRARPKEAEVCRRKIREIHADL